MLTLTEILIEKKAQYLVSEMILTYLNLKVYASRFVIPVVVYVISPHFAPYLVGANNRMNMKRKFLSAVNP